MNQKSVNDKSRFVQENANMKSALSSMIMQVLKDPEFKIFDIGESSLSLHCSSTSVFCVHLQSPLLWFDARGGVVLVACETGGTCKNTN